MLKPLRCLLVAATLLSACAGEQPEITALSKDSTIALISGQGRPGAVIAAQSLQIALAAGGLGPTDYNYYGTLQVAPAEVMRWVENSAPHPEKPDYYLPASAEAWWPSRAHFEALEFFEPGRAAPGLQGWIGVDRARGTLYFALGTT